MGPFKDVSTGSDIRYCAGYDITIDLMDSFDFVIEGISSPSSARNLVKSRQCGQSRPREFTEWVDVQAINGDDQAIGYGTS
jgi:hypothetical protein